MQTDSRYRSEPHFRAVPTPELEVIVAGQPFVGWTSVTIERSIDQLAHSFSVESITRWNLDEELETAIRIDDGDPVEIRYGEALLLTGYIDEVDESIGIEDWTVSLAGRSRAGDLCDCSVSKSKTWHNKPGIDIARDLVKPYGIDVQLAPGVTLDDTVRRLKADGDDTVQEVLERLAKQLGLLVVSTPGGDIEITGPGSRRAQRALLYGQNLASIHRTQNGAERFSDYIFRTQRSGSADVNGAAAAQVKASVTDEGVLRHRPLRVQAERQGSIKELERRAAWERNTRAGKALSLTVEVQALHETWKSGPGPLDIWAPNERVVVDVPKFDLMAEELLISAVTLTFDADGYGARLQLTAPEAYEPAKPPLKKKKKGKGTGW